MRIIIPFHKNQAQLDKCKKALEGQVKPFQILIEDDSKTENGFTQTVNAGLKKVLEEYYGNKSECSGEFSYVVILNQDCYLGMGAVQAMETFMDAHPKCAIAGIKQLSSENEDQIIHGGTLECFPAGRHEGGLVSNGDCAVSKPVPWVNGACMIVRLEALAEIGLMDPNYKMFASDSDWSYTARQRGWETWYIAEAVCVHEGGASQKMDQKMSSVFRSDARYFSDKWLTDEVYRELSMEVFV